MNKRELQEYARLDAEARLAAIPAQREEILALFPELRDGHREAQVRLHPGSAEGCPRPSAGTWVRVCLRAGQSGGPRRQASEGRRKARECQPQMSGERQWARGRLPTVAASPPMTQASPRGPTPAG
jgi:hypothetical protein